MIRYKFVLYTEIPTTTAEAELISDRTTIDIGRDGWNLVATTEITTGGKPGLLLSFQKEE